MYQAQVKITLKKTVADPQGLTVKHALEALGFAGLEAVRMGKLVTLKINAGTKVEAEAKVKQMCEKLLANPIIEDYSLEVEPL